MDCLIGIFAYENLINAIFMNRKIIFLHEDPESIKDSKSAMWHRYDDLIKWGRLIPVKSWMSDTKLNDISKYLN